MPIEANSLTPPSYMTGDAVPVADIKGISKTPIVDTRVQQGAVQTKWQIFFNMDPNKYANPIVWTATNESDMNTCYTELQAILQEVVVPES